MKWTENLIQRNRLRMNSALGITDPGPDHAILAAVLVAKLERRVLRLAEALYGEVVAVGGTIGGEQGLGLSRTTFFSRFFPELAAVFKRIAYEGPQAFYEGDIARDMAAAMAWAARACATDQRSRLISMRAWRATANSTRSWRPALS